jgi:hypothetical protein
MHDNVNHKYIILSCQDAAIQYWISQGAPREKVILGIGTYGRTFTLGTVSDCSIGAPATGAGHAGPYTREGGTLGYNEVSYLVHCCKITDRLLNY